MSGCSQTAQKLLYIIIYIGSVQKVTKSEKELKLDASSRWSVGLNFAWGSKETMTMRKTHPTLHEKHRNLLNSYYLLNLIMFGTDFFGFEIIFKCMSGSTTENGKFIMPLSEKLTYSDSSDRCDSKGFKRFSLIRFWKNKKNNFDDDLDNGKFSIWSETNLL